MTTDNTRDASGLAERVDALIARYSSTDACVAQLLCDGHDPDALAYRIVAKDLSTRDLTYGELRRESERLAAALAGLDIVAGTA